MFKYTYSFILQGVGRKKSGSLSVSKVLLSKQIGELQTTLEEIAGWCWTYKFCHHQKLETTISPGKWRESWNRIWELWRYLLGFSTSCLQNSLNPFAPERLSCIKFQEWNVRNLVKLRILPTRYFGHFSWRAFEKACMVRNTKKNPRGIFPSKEDLGFWGSFTDFRWSMGLKCLPTLIPYFFSHSFMDR